VADDAVTEPDNTAVRTALWRGLHVEVDAPPHVLEDTLGLSTSGEHSSLGHRTDENGYGQPRLRG
jgi:hypothetical protein